MAWHTGRPPRYTFEETAVRLVKHFNGEVVKDSAGAIETEAMRAVEHKSPVAYDMNLQLATAAHEASTVFDHQLLLKAPVL